MKNDDCGKMSKEEVSLYYWENGLMVFTEAFHKKRGYCCKSGCRHCPYGFKGKNADKKTNPF
jgi:hypothetical protein